MPETHSYGSGVFPSLAWHEGTWWLANQDHAWIHVWRDRERVQTLQMSGPDAAFTKLASFSGHLWLIYREGSTGRLVNLTTGERHTFGHPLGNNPHLLAEGHVWWQEAGGVFTAPVENVTQKTRVTERIVGTGITGIRNGQPLYWDDVRGSKPGMIQPTFAGDYCAGEGPHGGTVVRHLPSGRELWLWPGSIAFEPQCAWNGHELAVATWGEGVRRAIVQPHELLEPPPVPTPEPEPPPIPTPEPEPPAMPDSLLSTVQAVRAKYRNPSQADLGKMLNEIAWIHRADGWGLSLKPSGNHTTQPTTGKPVAVDILHHKPTDTIWDCFRDAGGATEPSWGEAHPHNDPSRVWVAPVAPEGVEPQPDPEPDPEPGPVPEPQPGEDVQRLILAELQKLNRHLGVR